MDRQALSKELVSKVIVEEKEKKSQSTYKSPKDCYHRIASKSQRIENRVVHIGGKSEIHVFLGQGSI